MTAASSHSATGSGAVTPAPNAASRIRYPATRFQLTGTRDARPCAHQLVPPIKPAAAAEDVEPPVLLDRTAAEQGHPFDADLGRTGFACEPARQRAHSTHAINPGPHRKDGTRPPCDAPPMRRPPAGSTTQKLHQRLSARPGARPLGNSSISPASLASQTPRSVIRPVTSGPGVTSNAQLAAGEPVGREPHGLDPPVGRPAAHEAHLVGSRCSIGISRRPSRDRPVDRGRRQRHVERHPIVLAASALR